MRILITNSSVASRSGTETYVRDLACGLLGRGHTPVVYTPKIGALARELRDKTVPVTDCLDSITEPPDIIHGHHNLETMTALLRFTHAPAIFVTHDNLARRDVPPRFPRILRYVAVDYTCRDRLVFEHGVPEEKTRVVLNSVNLAAFRPRAPLPARPRRALIFSNASSAHFAAVSEACAQSGLELDALGHDSGNVSPKPGEVLGRYDIVFAKGRSALEALAVGAAVVLCDFPGVGPMVTTGEFDSLRRFNFGHRTLRSEIRPEVIAREIARYDAADAAEVSRKVRAVAGSDLMLDEVLALYSEVMAEHAASPVVDAEAELRAAADYLRWLTLRLNEEEDARRNSPVRRIGKRLRGVPLVGRLARALDRRLLAPAPGSGLRRH
ncbi:MAG: glycosyltransferase [Acidobacteria bacterium]|nr:glycosyltransferase [Acidobacteriota bacterium]